PARTAGADVAVGVRPGRRDRRSPGGRGAGVPAWRESVPRRIRTTPSDPDDRDPGRRRHDVSRVPGCAEEGTTTAASAASAPRRVTCDRAAASDAHRPADSSATAEPGTGPLI